MQPATAKELPCEQAIFLNAWDALKTYYRVDATTTDEEWLEIVERCNQIGKMGEGTLAENFSRRISVELINYLEKLYKSRIKE